MKQFTIRLVCASVLTALALSGCAGGANGDDDRIGAFGTGYGSNGTRLFERDGRDDRPPGSGAYDARRAGGADSGFKGTSMPGVRERSAGGSGAGGSDAGGQDAGRSKPVGNGYDGITPDGAGSSDPRGADGSARADRAVGGTVLQLGGIRITDADAETGEGARTLRVTTPAARKALERLSRNLRSGRPSDKADEITRDLRIVLKSAR